jgi:hypothetical protein
MPLADQADVLRHIGALEERLEALSRRYSAVVHAIGLQRQTLATWLKFWEIAAAMEGESEANKRVGTLVAREKSEGEASRKAEKSAKPSTDPNVQGSVAGASGAAEQEVRMDKSVDARAQTPSSDRSTPSGRLIALEEAVSLGGVEKGEPVYLSGQFVVTASGRNRAVLRSVQGGAASLITRVIVEYGAGSAPPAQGATFPDDGQGRFEIREIRRWSPSQRPPAGEFEVFVKARSVANDPP